MLYNEKVIHLDLEKAVQNLAKTFSIYGDLIIGYKTFDAEGVEHTKEILEILDYCWDKSEEDENILVSFNSAMERAKVGDHNQAPNW